MIAKTAQMLAQSLREAASKRIQTAINARSNPTTLTNELLTDPQDTAPRPTFSPTRYPGIRTLAGQPTTTGLDHAISTTEITRGGYYPHPMDGSGLVLVIGSTEHTATHGPGIVITVTSTKASPTDTQGTRGNPPSVSGYLPYRTMQQNMWLEFEDHDGWIMPFNVFLMDGPRIFIRWHELYRTGLRRSTTSASPGTKNRGAAGVGGEPTQTGLPPNTKPAAADLRRREAEFQRTPDEAQINAREEALKQREAQLERKQEIAKKEAKLAEEADNIQAITNMQATHHRMMQSISRNIV